MLAVLPWAIAVVSFALAAAWLRSQPAQDSTPNAPAADSAELKTLRLALDTSKAENAALRQELDRLVGRSRGETPPSESIAEGGG